MSEDVVIEYDRQECAAEGCVVVPLDRITPDTLQRLVGALADKEFTLYEKVRKIAAGVRQRSVETSNIVPQIT